jgi:hypothetical protein
LSPQRIILLAALVSVVCQWASAAVSTAPAAQISSERAAVSDEKQRQRDRSATPAAAGARHKVQQGKGQTARANSDRVRSLLNRQASTRRTAAAASRRPAVPTTAVGGQIAATNTVAGNATRASGNPGPGAANRSQGLVSAMPNRAAPRAAAALPQNSAAKSGTLGGPRAQGYARLGGPASAKAGRTGALDGTQLPRRKY